MIPELIVPDLTDFKVGAYLLTYFITKITSIVYGFPKNKKLLPNRVHKSAYLLMFVLRLELFFSCKVVDSFQLTPYVSYKTPNVIQSEFTAQDLFDSVYSRKIEDDYRLGKLNDEGEPSEPSEAEKLTADEAKKRARMTGSDIFH